VAKRERQWHERAMISVIIPVRDEEEALLATLAALAPLAAQGLVADVVVADCGSRDATIAVADAAGCTIIEACADRASAIGAAVGRARKPWLLVLAAGDVPDEGFATAARQHIAQADHSGARRPAAFLSLPAGAGLLRRAALALRFDMLGHSAPQARRVLVPRAEAHLVEAQPKARGQRLWRGARLRARLAARPPGS
jgi:glycosyltransferase involved in cell wall biosynthesis